MVLYERRALWQGSEHGPRALAQHCLRLLRLDGKRRRKAALHSGRALRLVAEHRTGRLRKRVSAQQQQRVKVYKRRDVYRCAQGLWRKYATLDVFLQNGSSSVNSVFLNWR